VIVVAFSPLSSSFSSSNTALMLLQLLIVPVAVTFVVFEVCPMKLPRMMMMMMS
jgi:hypothetical protein